MRQFIATAALAAAALVTAAQPAYASVPKPGTIQAATRTRVSRDACRIELRSMACATYQRQLLNAVADDARITTDPQQVSNRQLDALIASVH